MPVIKVEGVTKEFRLGAMQGLVSMVSGMMGRESKAASFKALDDVSFTVEAGEVVGVVGNNGAGKSTLLKLMSKISQPTRGRIEVKGRVAPLIEVGAGLVQEMTGRENIYLNGAILGISRAELDRKFDEIVDFAELGRFIDTPIKRFSSGMQVRLGFAVATSVESDILIVDEVLAVGDVAFQRKCLDRMEDIIRHQERTVFVVSHNVRQIERFCSRVILLERGRLAMDGAPGPVCTEFFSRSNQAIKDNVAKQTHGRMVSEEIEIQEIGFHGPGARSASTVGFGESCRLQVRFLAKRPLKDALVGTMFHTTDLVFLTSHNNYGQGIDLPAGVQEFSVDIPRMLLMPGVYQVRLWIGNQVGRESFCSDGLLAFDVVTSESRLAQEGALSLFELPGQLRLQPVGEGVAP